MAIKGAPAKADRGMDAWRPREWAGLLMEAIEGPTKILQGIEKDSAWPAQVLQITIAFILRPTRGERPIAVTGGLYRLMPKVRNRMVMQREDKKVCFWESEGGAL